MTKCSSVNYMQEFLFLFCFNHSARTLTSVWQCLIPLSLRMAGSPLLLPFLLFSYSFYLPLKQRKQGQTNCRTWNRWKWNETKDCRVRSALLCGMGTFRLPWPPGVHHRLITHVQGKQLRYLHVPASSRPAAFCCDEPVETIDWLSLSLRWHVAYIVAASPNPQPRDDVLYKDSV